MLPIGVQQGRVCPAIARRPPLLHGSAGGGRGDAAAGPGAASRWDLLDMASSQTLLEQIIRQAQHVVLRFRTAYVLDTMARDLKDPLISCHWGTISSPTRTSVKVRISTICKLLSIFPQLIFREYAGLFSSLSKNWSINIQVSANFQKIQVKKSQNPDFSLHFLLHTFSKKLGSIFGTLGFLNV